MVYDPNWRQKALNEGKDQNSPEFAAMRAAEASFNAGGGGSSFGGSSITTGYDPNWRQKALNEGKDQNGPEFAAMRAAEASFNAGRGGSSMPALQPVTGFNQPVINLPQIYDNLYKSSGVSDLERELSDKEKAYIEAKGKVNDNPFLSEASRVGREAKLEKLYAERTANLKNDIAVKKADIETRLNLESKQFDIQSQQAKQALDQFNSLLSAGALDNASGEDVANIMRATGLSSSMIQSAIDVSRASKVKEIPTQTISFDDGTNQGFAIVNTQTGEIINKQTVAASKPTKESTSTAKEKQSQKEGAAYMITLYRNVNKNNPSWAKGHELRKRFSPNDFYNQLLTDYPEAASYIKATFTEGQ